MADQRWSQLARHVARRTGGMVHLAVALSLILLTGCTAELRTEPEFGPAGGTPGLGGGGGGASGLTNTALAGTWENIQVFEFDNDITRLTTRWTFTVAGVCSRTTVTESLIEGIPRTEVRACSYSIGGSNLLVEYVDTGQTSVMAAFLQSPTVLLLDQIVYDKVLQ